MTAHATRNQTPIGSFLCPTRRALGLYPYTDIAPANYTQTATVAKTDYAANGGDIQASPGIDGDLVHPTAATAIAGRRPVPPLLRSRHGYATSNDATVQTLRPHGNYCRHDGDSATDVSRTGWPIPTWSEKSISNGTTTSAARTRATTTAFTPATTGHHRYTSNPPMQDRRGWAINAQSSAAPMPTSSTSAWATSPCGRSTTRSTPRYIAIWATRPISRRCSRRPIEAGNWCFQLKVQNGLQLRLSQFASRGLHLARFKPGPCRLRPSPRLDANLALRGFPSPLTSFPPPASISTARSLLPDRCNRSKRVLHLTTSGHKGEGNHADDGHSKSSRHAGIRRAEAVDLPRLARFWCSSHSRADSSASQSSSTASVWASAWR